MLTGAADHCVAEAMRPLMTLTSYSFRQGYRAVLVLPCVYNRTAVKALAELLVNGLGFSSFFLIQVGGAAPARHSICDGGADFGLNAGRVRVMPESV